MKWLPNSQRIDPMSPLCHPAYDCMARRGMVLLSHVGEEHSVAPPEPVQVRWDKAVSAGVHCGVRFGRCGVWCGVWSGSMFPEVGGRVGGWVAVVHALRPTKNPNAAWRAKHPAE